MFHRKRSGSGGDGGKPRSKPGAKPFGVKQAAQKPAVKGKNASVKNQIRAVTRLLNKVRIYTRDPRMFLSTMECASASHGPSAACTAWNMNGRRPAACANRLTKLRVHQS